MVFLKEKPFKLDSQQSLIGYEVASLSDTGKLRVKNEDALGAFQFSLNQHQNGIPLGLFMVADGMGGCQAGDVAANIAVSTVNQEITRQLPDITMYTDNEEAITEILEDSFRQAHRNIMSAPAYRKGMGTTLVAALVINGTAYIANVGDSRAYLINWSGLKQITTDHSLAWMLASCGQNKSEDVYSHPRQNLLLRSLGSSEELVVDMFSEQLAVGDEMLLCSNGLWEMARDEEIEDILHQNMTPLQKVQHLIDLANANGGVDNITVVIIKATQLHPPVSNGFAVGNGTSVLSYCYGQQNNRGLFLIF
ncbi:MAG: protein serine/threonine phosphatase [Dehalococcoidia bacterium]|nr:protein serine/threonine phosphatase [Dehalococcoidia bacterium]MBF8303963.1 protein serine/threonine phosphatase [Dehalococcoidia bacterium]